MFQKPGFVSGVFIMLKFILLLILLWLLVRFVSRLVRMTFSSGNSPNVFSSSSRRSQVEEAEYEVIDSQIKQKE